MAGQIWSACRMMVMDVIPSLLRDGSSSVITSLSRGSARPRQAGRNGPAGCPIKGPSVSEAHEGRLEAQVRIVRRGPRQVRRLPVNHLSEMQVGSGRPSTDIIPSMTECVSATSWRRPRHGRWCTPRCNTLRSLFL